MSPRAECPPTHLALGHNAPLRPNANCPPLVQNVPSMEDDLGYDSMPIALDKIARSEPFAGGRYKQISAHTVVECEMNLDRIG